MKLVWLEGKRIIQKGWVLLCFLAFLTLGIWISELILEQSFQKGGCTVEQYLEVAESCRGMTLSKAAQYLSEKTAAALQALEIHQEYQMGLSEPVETEEKLASLGYGRSSLDELTFGILWSEREKYQRVWEEINLLLQYEDRMEQIRQGGGGLSGISLFNDDAYVMLTKEKAMRDYAGLQVELDTWQPNAASQEFLQNRVMDALIFLFLMVVVLLLYMEEKEKGYAELIAATRGGRQHFYIKKAGVLLGFTLFTVLIYEGMLLGYYVWRLGGITWDVPIQSIAAFEMCSHDYNVGTVIILTVLLKVLIFYILALALSALACRMSKSLAFLCVVSFTTMLAIVWEHTANINDHLGWLTCFNPVVLADTAGLITRYRQFPVFGKPVSEMWISGIFAGMLVPVSFVLGILGYAQTSKSKELLRFREKAGDRKGRSHRGIIVPAGSFGLELRKSMISYRMLLPVLAVSFVCVIGYFVLDGKALTRQEMFYRQYMMELNGPLTPEKEQFILEERERYHNLEVFRSELLAQGGDQGFLLSHIENEMARKSSFDLVELQYARIQEEGGVFLYETGYLYLMGIETNESGRIGVFLGIIMMTLLLPSFSWIELGGGADGLVRTTRRGRSRLLLTQYAVCFLAAFLLFGSICAEEAAKIFQQFGRYGIMQTAENISQLDGFMAGCSLGGYLLLVYMIRLLGVALAALLAMACLYHCRDYLSAVLLCGVFLVIPELLYINGFSFMRGYFMNALLQGEEFLMLICHREWGTILLVLMQMSLCVGASFWILRKEVKRR